MYMLYYMIYYTIPNPFQTKQIMDSNLQITDPKQRSDPVILRLLYIHQGQPLQGSRK